jgi:hypothetical protein
MTTQTGWVHHYISTACEHAVGEGKPELHASCRLSCKWAEDGQESCRCPCHFGTPPEELPPPWVDQARDLALELIDLLGGPRVLPGELGNRVATDPALFWARGEVQPPGEWQPADTD